MVVIPPHNLDPNSGKWGTAITKLLHDLLDGTAKANQTAERAIKANSDVLGAVAQTNQQVISQQNDTNDKSRVPAAPDDISTSTASTWDALGNPVANITVTWDVVSTDIDGNGIDISAYEVWWKTGAAVYIEDADGNPTTEIDPSAYKRLTATPALTVTTPVDSNTLYSFVVRAISGSGVNSAFSAASDITSDTPGGTIVAPTKPTVSQTVGVVSVVWDGALTSGSLPDYFRYVKVLQSTSSGGTYTDTGQTLSGPGGVAISGLTDGQDYYYKLQAVDSTNTASGLSVASDVITPEGVDLSTLEAEIDTANTNAATALSNANDAQTAADAAQTTADSASSDAAAAAGIANSKAVVLYQTATPSSTYQNDLTLWIDTTASANTPKRWSGSAWVAVTDKVATDAASTAAAANSTATAAQTAADAAQSTADTAVTNAASAQTTANTAQTTADGKNVVTYSTSAASSGTPGTKAGDVWFQQTSGGVVSGQWVWSGTAWIQQTLSNTVIASLDAGKITSGSIAAARIAANTITSAMIAANTIVAGDIAAGTITATQLAANTITAAKIAAGTITATEIASGAITTAKLDATAINGMTITGATVQTDAAASTGLKLDTDGISAYDSTGARTVFVDAATGALTATSGTFTGAINATAGSISGDIVVSGAVKTDATASRGIELSATGLFSYDASGNNTFAIDAAGLVTARTALTVLPQEDMSGQVTINPYQNAAEMFFIIADADGEGGFRSYFNQSFTSDDHDGAELRIKQMDASVTEASSLVLGSDGSIQLNGTSLTFGGFSLDSSVIPNLDASKITTGSLDVGRIPDLDAAKIASGTFDAALLTAIAASNLVLPLIPSANTDTPVGGSMATWLTLGNVVVPSWASRAMFTYSLNGIYLQTATGTNVQIKPSIGSADGTTVRVVDPGAVGQRFPHVANDIITGLTAGTQSFKFSSYRIAGTGFYRADASSYISVAIQFLP